MDLINQMLEVRMKCNNDLNILRNKVLEQSSNEDLKNIFKFRIPGLYVYGDIEHKKYLKSISHEQAPLKSSIRQMIIDDLGVKEEDVDAYIVEHYLVP
jgi:hypothetical protein